MSVDSTIASTIISAIVTVLLAILTTFAAFILYRKYVPKLELAVAIQRIEDHVFLATLFVRNVGHVLVGTHWCSLRVREWNDDVYADTAFQLTPVMVDGIAKSSGGCASWYPPDPDPGAVWRLDGGETLTMPFVVRCTTPPASLLFEATYCSRKRWPVISYQWKRLVAHDPAAEPSPPVRSGAGRTVPPTG